MRPRLREQIPSVPARRLRATRPMVRMAWVLLAVDVLAAVAITVMVILHTAPSATVPAKAALVFMALSFAVVGGAARSCSRTAWCTAGGPRRIRRCRTSPPSGEPVSTFYDRTSRKLWARAVHDPAPG